MITSNSFGELSYSPAPKMSPFPELHTVLSEKYFNDQLLDQFDSPDLIATNSYFPFSPPPPPTFAADGRLPDFLLFSTDQTTTDPHPPPPDFSPNPNAAMSKRINVVDHDDHGHSSSIRRHRKIIRTTTRKDRHSKISTANGLRNRRMRLSRDVGRKFFDLQDQLGFDTPSKTVQWLLDISESAINLELCKYSFSNNNQSPNDHEQYCISELGEDAASSIYDSKGKSAVLEVITNPIDQELKKSKSKRSAAYNQTAKKAAIINPTLKKESRDQARAKARERTREKKIKMSFLTSQIPIVTSTADNEPNSQSLNSSTCGEIINSQSNKQHMKLLDHSNQTDITGWNDIFYLFQEQWEMERAFLADAHFYSRQF